MAEASPTSSQRRRRRALDLFAAQGFEATSVEQIAQAAGVSRSTFFRQFGGKDDVVFSDHDVLLAHLRQKLTTGGERRTEPVGRGVRSIGRRLPPLRRRARTRPPPLRGGAPGAGAARPRDRDRLPIRAALRRLPALRAPGLDPIDAVAFSAAVTAVHNHVLRRLRGTEDIPESVLTDAYDELMHRFGVHPDGEQAQNDDVVVATFPVGCRWPRSCGACATSSERAHCPTELQGFADGTP
jgi:AcrR family transcriptional regulator